MSGSWLHVDDVDQETFDKWADPPPEESYLLARPDNLVVRARRVKIGDYLLMVCGSQSRTFEIVGELEIMAAVVTYRTKLRLEQPTDP